MTTVPLIDIGKVFAASLLERKSLYKFRTIDTAHPERIAAIFDGRLYCPSPAELNDPWECLPKIVMDPLTMDERRFFVDQLESLLALDYPTDLPIRLAEEVPADLMSNPKLFLDEDYYSSERLKAYCDRIMASLRRQASGWRVCSFSATRDHPLLWAHYADSHRGICIEFDASDVHDFGAALPVQYEDERPTVHWLRANALKNISMLTTKSREWEYEGEYRLIGREPYSAWEGAEIHDKIFRFPVNRITGVILGARLDEQRKRLVEDWLRRLRHGVTVTQARMDDDNYRLQFVDS